MKNLNISSYRYATPLSVVLLSDLHNKPYQRIIEQTASLRPDIIAVTGDVIFGERSEENTSVISRQTNVLPFLKACSEITPTFFSFGNHEWMLSDDDIIMIRDTGVTILDNEYVTYGGVIIGGLTSGKRTHRELYFGDDNDRARSYWQNAEPDIGWLTRFEEQKGFKVLLCHHPEYRDLYLKDRNIDLILSGHCHGGQIRLFGRGLFAPGQGLMPRYTRGIYGNMIVSAGLSNTAVFVPRLFNPREIVYISSRHIFVPDRQEVKSATSFRMAACECSGTSLNMI